MPTANHSFGICVVIESDGTTDLPRDKALNRSATCSRQPTRQPLPDRYIGEQDALSLTGRPSCMDALQRKPGTAGGLVMAEGLEIAERLVNPPKCKTKEIDTLGASTHLEGRAGSEGAS